MTGSVTMYRLEADGPDRLIAVLREEGYRVVGPRVEDGAIVIQPYEEGDTLPRGVSEVQTGGHYRLVERGDGKLFDYTVGPQGFKRYLWPPHQTLWSANRTEDGGFTVQETQHDEPPLALFAARACEIDALSVLDGVFDNGDFVDPTYRARRERALIVAVECTRAAETCFCASMNSGPAVEAGFDIALTELFDGSRHTFLARSGSAKGASVLARLAPAHANEEQAARRDAVIATVAESQTRRMPGDARAVLKANPEHPRWEAVAERCLSCGSCTSVCPTCFCTTTIDHTDLTASHASRERVWDSCFAVDYSYIFGGAIRRSTKARYRQWMMHKLTHWYDQFGRAGCVGCGRCITWCPVGIDIVEETTAIRAGESAGHVAGGHNG